MPEASAAQQRSDAIRPFHKSFSDAELAELRTRIKEEDPSWEQMVPPEVAARIKQRGFFGCREADVQDAARQK